MQPHAEPGGSPAADTPGLVRDLSSLDTGMLDLAGGKAANLGELMSAGLPVPDGFCLTTEAYRRATGAPASLLPGLAYVQAALKPEPGAGPVDPSALADLAAGARSAILAAPIPADIAAAVEQAYRGLGHDVPVAVRSSATAEDLPFASFAGQQDTYLNVVGVAPVLEAVRKCWASLWTDRATTYRAGLGIDPAGVALAVAVQRMVEAETAGVMFTANPLTGRRGHAVIDASPGLGEAVVSGAVNPDHYVVDALTGRVLERKPGDKKVVVRAVPGGGTRTLEAPDAAAGECLDDAQAAALARLGRQAEQYFGAPQDIEWAIDGSGTLWLTQSRPITTLYPVPQRAGAQGGTGTRVYLCFSLAQGLTRPITPMGRAAFRLIASSVAQAARFHVPDPRRDRPLRGGRPAAVLRPHHPAAEHRGPVDPSPRVRRHGGPLGRPVEAALRRARVLRDTQDAAGAAPPCCPRRRPARAPESLLRGMFRPAAALRRLDRFTRDFEAALEAPPAAGPAARLEHAEMLLRTRLFTIVPAILPLPALGFAMLAVAGKVLGGARWTNSSRCFAACPTT
ncbi:PEP/pyruvate-binding domain-containing protein [Arthrobacter sp. SD76]|uniref:PEP/pyruvate-binding domain-containing protein n=1 Tax=Arthrobacter sp. SD76 TaxID=3415007 RepID=UPI003C775AAF